MTDFKVDDWVVFDMRIGQIKKIEDDDYADFSDGTISTCGRLVPRFRPLTLRNKVIAEGFDYIYDKLRQIDGQAGFNYPRIFDHFCQLALEAIDNEGLEKEFYEQANAFVMEAREHNSRIQGVNLFRPAA